MLILYLNITIILTLQTLDQACDAMRMCPKSQVRTAGLIGITNGSHIVTLKYPICGGVDLETVTWYCKMKQTITAIAFMYIQYIPAMKFSFELHPSIKIILHYWSDWDINVNVSFDQTSN